MSDREPTDAEVVERELRDLAARAEVVRTDATADAARGRRHVRHRRVGVGAVALVVAGGVAGAVLLGGGPVADRSLVATGPTAVTTATDPATTATESAPTEPPEPTAPTEPSSPPSSPAPPADPRDAKQLLTDWRDVIAEYVDPRDRHLERVPSNVQSGGGMGTKLGWSQPGEEGLGMVQVFVSSSWRDQWYMWCDRYQDCQDLRVGRIDARVLAEDGTTWVGVQHPEGFVVALSVDALFGNNSTVPVDGLDVSVEDLARIAADDRFSLPTPQQVRGSGGAFGFPGP